MTTEYPGFADPVRDSQATFRAVLDAMARPGRIHAVHAPLAPPPGLDRATACVLLTLVDAETPLALAATAAAFRAWIVFHCGAPIVPPASARFALGVGPAPLDAFATGSDEAPEDGATVILQLPALGAGPALRLAGPGLAAPADLHVTGLPPGFAAAWEGNRALFPRGVDLILCAGDRLAALPRTVRIDAA